MFAQFEHPTKINAFSKGIVMTCTCLIMHFGKCYNFARLFLLFITALCQQCFYKSNSIIIINDLFMSISKKRAQKSQNHNSFSQVSNSQNLRDSSLFKNQYLSDIQNIHPQPQSQVQSSRKQQFQSNSLKKKVTTQMKQHIEGRYRQCCDKYKENKIVNYTGLSKMLDQRNVVINTQQKQIQSLKNSLDRVKKQLQVTRSQFEKKKIQDMGSLKKQQKDNEQNIKQLQILRVGMRQLKNKIETLQHQKQHLQKKSNQYLQENEQITIKMTSLKQEYNTRIPDQKLVMQLKNQVNLLKEQAKITKQLEMQKVALEERCRNFEKKINDYILRYNEVQADYNQNQIKYYRAQKQNDDLKMNIDQLKIQNKNLKKMLEEQKKILSQQTQRWKIRISKLEEYQKSDRNANHLQSQLAISQIETSFTRLQQLSQMQQKLQQKTAQVRNLNIKLSYQTAQLQSINKQLLHCHSVRQTNQAEMHQNIRKFEQQLLQIRHQLSSKKEVQMEYQKTISVLRKEVQQHKMDTLKLNQELNQMKESRSQLEKYVNSQEQVIGQLKIVYSKLEIQMNRRIEELTTIISNKDKEISIIVSKNGILNNDLRQISDLLKGRAKQAEELKLLLSKKSSDTEIVNKALQSSQTGRAQYEQRLLKLQNQLDGLAKQLKEKQNQLSSKQTELRQKRIQLIQKQNQIYFRQSSIKHLQMQLAQSAKKTTEFQAKYQAAQHQLSQMQSVISQYQSTLESKQQTLAQKLTSLEINVQGLHRKNVEQAKIIQQKDGEIQKLQQIINGTNGELREIQSIVHQYREKINGYSITMQQADRKLQNQLYLSKQAQLKWQEQVRYFKGKYQDNFKQNISLSNRICQLQREHLQQLSKVTEQGRMYSSMQQQINQINQEKHEIQSRLQAQIQCRTHQYQEYCKARQQIQNYQDLFVTLSARIGILDTTKHQLDKQLKTLNQNQINLKQAYEAKFNQMNRRFEDDIKQMQQSMANKQSQQYFKEAQHTNLLHLNQILSLKQKLSTKQAQIIELSSVLKQKQLSLKQYLQAQSLSEQLLHKNMAMQSQKQSQQLMCLKQYNVKLSSQLEQLTLSYQACYRELESVQQEHHRCAMSRDSLSKQIQTVTAKNNELIEQLSRMHSKYSGQIQMSRSIINDMKCQIVGYQQKIKYQCQQISVWMTKCQSTQKQYKKAQHEVNKVSRGYLEESNRKNKQNSREIETYRTQIKLLQEENGNLQKIMDKELNKRKNIIEELINQKKMLYEQIGTK